MTYHFKQGLRAGGTIVPTFIAIFAGFGIASQVVDLPAFGALAMTAFVLSAPAQLAMLDLAGHSGSSVLQVLIAGILVNLRFFLMSLTLAHLFPRLSRGKLAMTAQMVIASTYLLTYFRSRKQPPVDLHKFFLGVATMGFPAAIIGTSVGIWFGVGLPSMLTFGATLFLPIYFALLLAGEVRGRFEITAVLLGFVLTPPMELLLPGWGLLVTALVVGGMVTVAER